jgi:hypothetical protein
MAYWITETLAVTPAFASIYVILGGVFAFALLSRADWRDWGTVGAAAVFGGAAVLTIWMFILGMAATALDEPLLSNEALVNAGAMAAAAVCYAIAWNRWRQSRGARVPAGEHTPWRLDERALVVMIIAALIVRWIVIAYWPFTAYDTLWVYGYLGRLFFLEGAIPNTIGYYPQYLSLQYTFGQLAWGGISDHAARAGLIFLHAGSILAAYALGRRLFGRRTGIYAAAIWALYPHVGEWSRAGDLEIVLTGLFALSAAFFLTAWRRPDNGLRDALVAGIFLGIGLWTKPTMGAFIWGVLLLCAVEMARCRMSLRAAWPRLRIALVVLAACVPLGGAWYIRNLLLGLDPIVLPSGFWVSIAARSGAELGWPLLALSLYTLYACVALRQVPMNYRLLVPGIALTALGVAPSIISPRVMVLPDWALLLGGLGLGIIALARHARAAWTADMRRDAASLGWAALLALPFFITWFYSYSYHYRLSFPIVPLMILPVAWVLARWTVQAQQVRPRLRPVLAAACIALGLPGVVSAVPDPFVGADYLWSGEMPDDHARYASGNAALMRVVDGLNIWLEEHPGETLRVAAPGVLGLPFFFPQQDIRVSGISPTLAGLEDVAYVVAGVPESGATFAGLASPEVPFPQMPAALGRTDIFRRAWGHDDGNFRYDVYESSLANRFTLPFINAPSEGEIVFGGQIRYLGHDLGGLEFWPGRRLIAHLFWQPVSTPDRDLTVLIHLLDAQGNLIVPWDGKTAPSEYGYYDTRAWEPGEIISDERVFSLAQGEAPAGQGYQLGIGFYDGLTGERLRFTRDGEDAGDVLVIENRISVLAQQP